MCWFDEYHGCWEDLDSLSILSASKSVWICPIESGTALYSGRLITSEFVVEIDVVICFASSWLGAIV